MPCSGAILGYNKLLFCYALMHVFDTIYYYQTLQLKATGFLGLCLSRKTWLSLSPSQTPRHLRFCDEKSAV